MWQLGFREVEVNIDSMKVVNIIKTGKFSSPVGIPLVKSIMQLLERKWVVEMFHCYRGLTVVQTL